MRANNMAAMREALEKIVELTAPCEGVTSIELQVQAEALTALSKPPRNCDRFNTPEEAIRMFESDMRESGKVGFINPFTEVVKWLFAPVEEHKGE